MRTVKQLLIGSKDDPHLHEVFKALASDTCLVLDLETLSKSKYAITLTRFEIEIEGDLWVLEEDQNVRAWLRRLAPDEWIDRVHAAPFESVEISAWVSLLAGLLKFRNISWITKPDDVLIAENKIHQLATAEALHISIPKTLVTNRPELLDKYFQGEAQVVKALAYSIFQSSERTFVQ